MQSHLEFNGMVILIHLSIYVGSTIQKTNKKKVVVASEGGEKRERLAKAFKVSVTQDKIYSRA